MPEMPIRVVRRYFFSIPSLLGCLLLASVWFDLAQAAPYPDCNDQICIFDARLPVGQGRCELYCQSNRSSCQILERDEPLSKVVRRCRNAEVQYHGHGHNGEYLKQILTEWTQKYDGGELRMSRSACEEARPESFENWSEYFKQLKGKGVVTCQQNTLFDLDDQAPVTFHYGNGSCRIEYPGCEKITHCAPSELGKSVKCIKKGESKPVDLVCCFSDQAHPYYVSGDKCPKAAPPCDGSGKGANLRPGILAMPCVGTKAYSKLPDTYPMDCGSLKDHDGRDFKGLCCKNSKGDYLPVCCRDRQGFSAAPDKFYLSETTSSGRISVVTSPQRACEEFPEPWCGVQIEAGVPEKGKWTVTMDIHTVDFGLPPLDEKKWNVEVTSAHLLPLTTQSTTTQIVSVDVKKRPPFETAVDEPPSIEGARKFVYAKATVCLSLKLDAAYRRCQDTKYCSTYAPEPRDNGRSNQNNNGSHREDKE